MSPYPSSGRTLLPFDCTQLGSAGNALAGRGDLWAAFVSDLMRFPKQAPSTAQTAPPPPPVPLVGAPGSRYAVASAAYPVPGSAPSPPPPAVPPPPPDVSSSGSGDGSVTSVTDEVAGQAAGNVETMLSVFGPASTASFVSACAPADPCR